MKVLIVDDSSFITLFCRQALTKAGYEVVGEAYDGEEAVEKALALKPHLVLMDIALPKKNGFDASQIIMEKLPRTKIIAISALEEAWLSERCEQSSCVSYLTKPFDAKTLIDEIKKIFDEDGELMYG